MMYRYASTRYARWSAALVAIAMLVAADVSPIVGRAQQAPAATSTNIHVQPVRENLFMLVGGGGNVTVQTGAEGVLMVDSGAAGRTDQLLATVRALSKAPIRFVLNTSAHPDYTSGNTIFRKAGVNLRTGSQNPGDGAEIVAHLDVMRAMLTTPSGGTPRPSGDYPTTTFLTPQKEYYFNDEPVIMIHTPAALRAAGESIVFFRRSDAISTGAIFDQTAYPMIDVDRGGTINGLLAALNLVLNLTVAKTNQDFGTMVIPGRGRLSNEYDVVEYRDMLTIIRDRVQNMLAKKMTLQQVRMAAPTADYDPRWGSETGDWTTAMFIEAVYKSLSNTTSSAEGGRR